MTIVTRKDIRHAREENSLRSINLGSGVYLSIVFFFASLLLWLEKTNYRDKGRGHDRRLTLDVLKF